MSYLIDKCEKLNSGAKALAKSDTKLKNEALDKVAKSLLRNKEYILKENQKDVIKAKEMNIKESLIDRLRLNENRINGMIDGIRKVIDLDDPVWKSDKVWTLENGLTISKMAVPLGVIGIIYESRPNVTVEAFSLALKSGNGILLRGSSSAINSNRAIVNAIKEGLENSSISQNAIEFIDREDRSVVGEMLTLNKYIDVIIPRGGEELIKYVVENSTVPTIETGIGNCHIFVDETADIKKAIDIVKNAKAQRPGVCNACETVLVHKKIVDKFLPQLYSSLKDIVELRGCSATKSIIDIKEATEEDWAEEYLDYILAIKIVEDVHAAIDHIGKYGTKHSEAILTESLTNANIFQREVDAAAVYVNASTRFTDGGQFGYGGEMGISTQKIHARGPVGLNELVTVKYTIMGNGQIRE